MEDARDERPEPWARVGIRLQDMNGEVSFAAAPGVAFPAERPALGRRIWKHEKLFRSGVEREQVGAGQKRDFVQRLASLGRGWDSLSLSLGPARVV